MSVYIQSIEKNPGNGAATIEMRGIPANMPLERISQCLGLAVSWLSWITTEDIKKTPDAQFEIKRRPTTDAEFVDQCGFLYGNIEKESDGEKILVLSFLYPEMPTNPDWARREKIFDDIVFSRMRSYVGDASLLSCSEGEGLRKYRFRSRKLPGDAGHTGGHPCLACFLNYLRNEFVEALRNKLGIKGPNPVSFVEALSEVGMSVPKKHAPSVPKSCGSVSVDFSVTSNTIPISTPEPEDKAGSIKHFDMVPDRDILVFSAPRNVPSNFYDHIADKFKEISPGLRVIVVPDGVKVQTVLTTIPGENNVQKFEKRSERVDDRRRDSGGPQTTTGSPVQKGSR